MQMLCSLRRRWSSRVASYSDKRRRRSIAVVNCFDKRERRLSAVMNCFGKQECSRHKGNGFRKLAMEFKKSHSRKQCWPAGKR